MAQRTTRNKIRHQAVSALADLYKAQNHLTQLAALADERSDFINEYLPTIMASLETVVKTIEQFQERL